MQTPRLRRRSRTTDTKPVQPVSVPEQIPAHEPVQDEPQPRTSRRAERAARRTAERAAKTESRTNARTKKANRPSRSTKLRNKLDAKLREKAAEPAALTPDARAGLMGVSRRGALVAITVLDLLATAVSFGESWDALYQWATHHGLKGAWAVAFPLQIDTFIAMGELALFIAILDHWAPRTRVWAWVSVFGGLAVSMVGNIGHVTGHPISWQATAAVPPLAAMAGMFIGFQVLKRVMNPTKAASLDQEHLDIISQLRHQVEELSHQPVPAPRPPEPQPEPAYVPAQRPAPEPFKMGTFPDDPGPALIMPEMMSQAANQVVGPDGSHPAQIIPDQDDVQREGAPVTSLYPEPPVDIVAKPVRRTLPETPRPRKRGGKHPKWDEAVQKYKASGATKDERLSQRELSAAIGLKNRSLATRVIDHVENGGE